MTAIFFGRQAMSFMEGFVELSATGYGKGFHNTVNGHSNHQADNSKQTDTGYDFSLKGAEEFYEDAEELNTYLNLENITDNSLREFVDVIDKRDKKMILVFFGDHQPSRSGTEECGDMEGTDDMFYRVPYMIHANYDIERSIDNLTSPNYLTVHLLEHADIGLNGYFGFISEIEKRLPVISAGY